MKRTLFLGMALVFLVVMALTACTSQTATGSESPSSAESVSQTTETSESPATIKDIKFYGKVVEYTSGVAMCEKLQELLADKYNIDCLQVDWGNLDQVIRTGIASGDPCDIYEYWPQYMKPYVDEGMALDLTPYLDADNGAWRKTFNETLLNIANLDGKIYNVPIDSNFPVIIANKDWLADNGITIPENWNWDQFLNVCQQIKDLGLFPFAMPTDNQKQDWMISNGLLSLAGSNGMLEQMKNADIPCTDQIFIDCFTKVKDVYDKGYMYPGQGAVSLTTDEGRAAFYQEKVALTAEVAAGVGAVVTDSPFECTIIPWPSMGTQNYVLGGCDGLFIPANVKDPDAAVEVLKTYTSADVMKIHAENGYAVANSEVEITDPLVKEIVNLSAAIYPYEFKSFDAKLNDYVISQALPEIVLGSGPEACANALEELRAAAKAQS